MVLARPASLVAELTLGATASAFSGLRPESSNLTLSLRKRSIADQYQF